jgi:ATP-binding cassette subfamily B protein
MNKVKEEDAKRNILFYYHAIKKYPKYIALLLIFIPLAVISSSILPPIILASVIEQLSNQQFVAGEPFKSFAPELIAYTFFMLSSGMIFWRGADYAVWKLEGKVQKDLVQKVFSHLMSQSSDFHANHFGGSLVSQTNKLLGSYVRIADTTFFGLLPLIINVTASAIVLSTKSIGFAFAIVIFAVSYIYISIKVSKPVRNRSAVHASAESKQTGYLSDAITNVLAIKSFARTNEENSTFAKVTDNTQSKLMYLMKASQRQMLIFSSMTSMISIFSLIAAIVSVVSFGANIGTAFLIFNFTATIVAQLFQFSNQALRSYNRAIGDSEEMIEILSSPAEIMDKVITEEPRINEGNIELKNVSFTHNDSDSAIFNNLNLKINSGHKIGLVGHSGSGKSTLVKLLLRFADINKGSITIDGQDITNITQEDLRSFIAYVPQEPLLFHRTIEENISYGDLKASKNDVIKASKKANADNFIKNLPKKYQTMVGERGVKLSGGQRQRVAIARAMLKNAPILLLDEATSALDSESEQLIQDALWKLMVGKTAIVIAHRLSTIQRMDRIIVLDNGKIVEDGSHKELLKKKGQYAKLWKHQSGGFLQD